MRVATRFLLKAHHFLPPMIGRGIGVSCTFRSGLQNLKRHRASWSLRRAMQVVFEQWLVKRVQSLNVGLREAEVLVGALQNLLREEAPLDFV